EEVARLYGARAAAAFWDGSRNIGRHHLPTIACGRRHHRLMSSRRWWNAECAHDLETGAAQPQCAVRGIPSRHASGSDEAQSTSVTRARLIDGNDQLAVVVAAIQLGNRAGRV